MPDRDSSSHPDRIRSAFAGVVEGKALESDRIHRFIHGIDEQLRVMTDQEVAKELNDPFATLLLRQGNFPNSLQEILSGIDAAVGDEDKLKTTMSFWLGEGSHLLFSQDTKELDRGIRFAVTKGLPDEIDVLVSTNPPETFLQVIGWDRQNGVFHYYERKNGTWIWAGNSAHALDPRSRGEGPFDSHINGSLVMKELKFPWNHWSSVAFTIPPEIFAPDDPTRNDPQFQGKVGAEIFEKRVVMPGVRRWTESRFAKTVPEQGAVQQLPALLEQLFVTTAVNLTSSQRLSSTVRSGERVDLPNSFFVDLDLLSAPTVGLPAPPQFEVPADLYLGSLERFEFALVDEEAGFRQVGDTNFAFFVPERGFEDLDVVLKCLEIGLLSDRFVGCVSMVDFANPVFSERRAQLFQQAPENFQRPGDLPQAIADAIQAAAEGTAAGSPEREFVDLWSLGDGWRAEASKRLQNYYTAVAQQLETQDGFDDYVRLAESRRRRVARLDIAEQRPLLFARTNLPDDQPHLEMRPDGSVQPTD